LKAKFETCQLLPGGTTLYNKFDEYGINTCVQNKTALKCAKNHGN